jgi:hypothetical protein
MGALFAPYLPCSRGGETDSKSQDLQGLTHLVRVYNIDIWVWIEMLLGMKQEKQ